MKKTIVTLFFICATLVSFAKHITGGEVIYNYLKDGINSKFYKVTLILFRDNLCGINCAQLPTVVTIGIYNNDNNTLEGGFKTISISSEISLPILAAPGCLSNAPNFNYSGGYYPLEIELPDNKNGYTFAYQTCCRISGITNVPPVNNQQDQGATFTSVIPPNGKIDNSARFQTGISIICYNKKYTLDFSASDADNDSLVYSLCTAYDGGPAASASFSRPEPPPYNSLIYNPGYSGAFPFGSAGFPAASAVINPATGIITGIAPDAGQYVVSVCVSSYRDGVFINLHRKDFIITVSPCDLSSADLDLSYSNCKDSTFTFQNNNTSPLNLTFLWSFGDGATSTEQTPTHTYADTGRYNIKLVVNQGTECADSATSTLLVFPQFKPDFSENSPTCKNVAVQFKDLSFATYGPVNSWKWNFGDPSSGTSNNSNIKDPTHVYASTGFYQVTLISSSIKGCRDTLSKQITIVDKPSFKVSNDTLICSIDTLQIHAVLGPGFTGKVVWSPNYNINNINSFNPLVSPDVTTTYVASYSDLSGCIAIDSVKVRVVDLVNVSKMPDTTICRTDSVQLKIVTDGLDFTWTPAALLSNPKVQDPFALPTASNTTFHVRASIGKCYADADINIKTEPYPKAYAGPDTSVCYGFNVQLQASGGSIYNWAPPYFLNATNISNPVSQKPTASVSYVVTVRDTLGCPKPVNDTILVKVIRIIANAGPSDTSVVLGQPLQLNGTGGTIYNWTPVTYLNNPNISNPVSKPLDSIIYFLKVSDSSGCFGYDTIKVRLFRISPGLYVPTAFTPNGNGVNDLFRPIALGMRSLESFRVYNRFGELVYSTKRIGEGWDGLYKGASQGTGTFVWYAEATDYLGKKIKKKGTVVLVK